MGTDLHFKTAVELAAMIRAKEIGCVDLLEHFLTRCDRLNAGLNAIIVWKRDEARARAQQADEALANGEVWGPLHGGANQAVIEMLETIMNDGGGLKRWIDKAKDKNDSFRLMGFGHRVYKNFDPRAKIIKKAADDVLEKLGIVDPVLDIAKELEEVALNDDYFKSRGLYPNVDFYSGIIYRALGIPTEMFTVMFAMGRLPGWIAQWKEMMEDNQPIGRPRQIYTGHNERNYQNIDKR